MAFSAPGGWRSSRTKRDIPLSAADQAVLDWVGTYSSQIRLVGGCILGKLRGRPTTTRIFAQIEDASELDDLFTADLLFSDIYAEGNTISFTFEGARYEVVNLLPDVFSKQLTTLAQRVVFAHEAISYDPATQTLKDPFGAVSSATLKVVHAGSGVAAAFENILRAWPEVEALGLKLGPAFAQLKKRVFSAPGSRAGLAKSVVAALVARLPQLTDVLSAEQIEGLLRSRLVATAVSRVLGVDVKTVLTQFAALRAGASGDDADAVAWLASLLSGQLQQGILPDWFTRLEPVQARRSRATLSQAYWLVRAGESQQNTPN
ncbi:hypothetical protein ACXR0O_16750 [Verrucomicrobiota bacterium sgz303538]